jgi:hypothetical protein
MLHCCQKRTTGFAGMPQLCGNLSTGLNCLLQHCGKPPNLFAG